MERKTRREEAKSRASDEEKRYKANKKTIMTGVAEEGTQKEGIERRWDKVETNSR